MRRRLIILLLGILSISATHLTSYHAKSVCGGSSPADTWLEGVQLKEVNRLLCATGENRLINVPPHLAQGLVAEGEMATGENKLIHSGTVKRVGANKIVLEYDGSHSFIINRKTKICVDGFRASWRELLGSKEASVATRLNGNIALEISNQPLTMAMGGLSEEGSLQMRVVEQECKPKPKAARAAGARKWTKTEKHP